jgi:hypothetical protein
MKTEQIKKAFSFSTGKETKKSDGGIKKNPAVENILKSLVEFKPTEANTSAESEKIEALFYGVRSNSEGKKSEFPEEKFIKSKSEERPAPNPARQTPSLAEEIAHKRVLYQYVISHVEIEELMAYIKTLSSPSLLKSFESALKERDKAEYKKFVEAACEFQIEEKQERAENDKAILGDSENDDEVILKDANLDFVFGQLENAPILEIGLLLAIATEYKMHDECIAVIDHFAESISSHEHNKVDQDKNDVTKNPEKKKEFKQTKFESPEAEERLSKISALLQKRFNELATHEDKQKFCAECLDMRKMMTISKEQINKQKQEIPVRKDVQKKGFQIG